MLSCRWTYLFPLLVPHAFHHSNTNLVYFCSMETSQILHAHLNLLFIYFISCPPPRNVNHQLWAKLWAPKTSKWKVLWYGCALFLRKNRKNVPNLVTGCFLEWHVTWAKKLNPDTEVGISQETYLKSKEHPCQENNIYKGPRVAEQSLTVRCSVRRIQCQNVSWRNHSIFSNDYNLPRTMPDSRDTKNK